MSCLFLTRSKNLLNTSNHDWSLSSVFDFLFVARFLSCSHLRAEYHLDHKIRRNRLFDSRLENASRVIEPYHAHLFKVEAVTILD